MVVAKALVQKPKLIIFDEPTRGIDVGAKFEIYHMLAELAELGDHHVFDAIIKQTVRLGEAPLAGVPVTTYAKRSDAAEAYREAKAAVADRNRFFNWSGVNVFELMHPV